MTNISREFWPKPPETIPKYINLPEPVGTYAIRCLIVMSIADNII